MINNFFGYILDNTTSLYTYAEVFLIKRIASLSEIGNDKYPVLIIGLDNAKKLIPKDKFNALERRTVINNRPVWWTFSDLESHGDYNKDFDDFKKFCYSQIETYFKYSFADVLTMSHKRLSNLFDYLNDKSTIKKAYLIDNKFAYIICGSCRTILGISLSDLEWFGFDIAHILCHLVSFKGISEVLFQDDLDCDYFSFSKELSKLPLIVQSWVIGS